MNISKLYDVQLHFQLGQENYIASVKESKGRVMQRTAARLYLSRKNLHSANIRAVFLNKEKCS